MVLWRMVNDDLLIDHNINVILVNDPFQIDRNDAMRAGWPWLMVKTRD